MFTLTRDAGYDPYNSADTRGTRDVVEFTNERDANNALARSAAELPAFLRKQAE